MITSVSRSVLMCGSQSFASRNTTAKLPLALGRPVWEGRISGPLSTSLTMLEF